MAIFKIYNPVENYWLIQLGSIIFDVNNLNIYRGYVGIDLLQYRGYFVKCWDIKGVRTWKPMQPLTRKEIARREYQKRIDFQP